MLKRIIFTMKNNRKIKVWCNSADNIKEHTKFIVESIKDDTKHMIVYERETKSKAIIKSEIMSFEVKGRI